MSLKNKEQKNAAKRKKEVKEHNDKIRKLKKSLTPEQRKEFLALQTFNQFIFDVNRKIKGTQGISALVFFGNDFAELSANLTGDMNIVAASILATMREDKNLFDLLNLLVSEIKKEGIYDVKKESENNNLKKIK